MYHEFIISPAGKEKLDSAKLSPKIAELRNKCSGLLIHLYADDLRGFVRAANKSHYKKGPKEFVPGFRKTLSDIFENPQTTHTWKIHEADGTTTSERVVESDILIISGYIASLMLKPKDFWNHTQYGFSSATDLFGTVGATFAPETSQLLREGHMWESTSKGQKYRTQITGDMNGDLRIYRTNITPHPTTDPFGNAASYRPVTRRDASVIAARDSTEPTLLGAVLKYIDEQKLDVPILRNNAQDFLALMRSSRGERGPYSDTGQHNRDARMVMIDFAFPFGGPGGKHGSFHIPRTEGEAYGAHADSQGNFALSLTEQTSNGLVLKKNPRLVIPPDDIEQFIIGIFAQAQKGLGRTSLLQLIVLLEYRFSSQFIADMKRMNRPSP